MRIDEEMILSDGESLPMMSWERLTEYQGNSNKLAAKLGRTPHYAKKNKSNLQLLDDDRRMIEREIKRRMALTTFSFCGLVFHWQGQIDVVLPDGGKDVLHTLKRIPTLSRYGGFGYRPAEEIRLTGTELHEYISRGAIQTKLDDPLAPFRVAECPWDERTIGKEGEG